MVVINFINHFIDINYFIIDINDFVILFCKIVACLEIFQWKYKSNWMSYTYRSVDQDISSFQNNVVNSGNPNVNKMDSWRVISLIEIK